MSDANPESSAVVMPGTGAVFEAFGEEAHFLLTGAETGGKYTQWIEVTPPGHGPPAHFHTREDEWFHVMEGRFSFLRNGEWAEVPEGAAVYMPKGEIHAFKNVGEESGRLLITTAPSGFEVFFGECAGEFAKAAGPDMAKIAEICARHGIYFVP
jgi:quercetin dioxygenase-like cupin family protein